MYLQIKNIDIELTFLKSSYEITLQTFLKKADLPGLDVEHCIKNIFLLTINFLSHFTIFHVHIFIF